MRSGRRPSPEGTRLLFAGAIVLSPMICQDDGPTESRHDKTRWKTRQEKKRQENKIKDAGRDRPKIQNKDKSKNQRVFV